MPVTKFNRHPLIKCLLERYEQKCQMSVSCVFLFIFLRKMRQVQSAKPPVHLFKTKRFYFEVLFQNEASLLEQNQTAFKWTSNPI